ncbi:hypothetical protein K0M31_006464 [Melipona bicolor]|uniref:Uncharacterized protein n=1 Tax=Melipona bicolor TaxID=60889 RepID=A0AA40KLS4_9HYME|nr:hypothetical protein K0M31_006464 [Melipona bicolor]
MYMHIYMCVCYNVFSLELSFRFIYFSPVPFALFAREKEKGSKVVVRYLEQGALRAKILASPRDTVSLFPRRLSVYGLRAFSGKRRTGGGRGGRREGKREKESRGGRIFEANDALEIVIYSGRVLCLCLRSGTRRRCENRALTARRYARENIPVPRNTYTATRISNESRGINTVPQFPGIREEFAEGEKKRRRQKGEERERER